MPKADAVGIDFDEPATAGDSASQDSDAAIARAERLRALGYGNENGSERTRETLTSDERAERSSRRDA